MLLSVHLLLDGHIVQLVTLLVLQPLQMLQINPLFSME